MAERILVAALMALILGISAYYHDSAAALIRDGVIIAAAQEERFSRIKHDPAFPAASIRYCLAEANASLADVSAVVFYDKPLLKFERLLESYMASAPRGFGSFVRAMPVWLKEKLYLKTLLRRELCALSGLVKGQLPPLRFAEHHQSHAASAFFPSPFARAAVLCLDGVGEWATSSAWLGEGNQLTPLWEIQFPHSLGLLYSAFTYYCGFKVNSGEYKLMGLAPYGEPRYAATIRRHLIDIKADGSFRLDLSYFNYVAGDTMTGPRFHALFGGPPRDPQAPLTQKEMDLARSIQQVTEEIVLALAASLKAETGADQLCLAGGVALNCVANGRLLREGPFSELWIQPAAGDAGGALGAALACHYQLQQQPRTPQPGDSQQGSLLGPAFDEAAISAALADWQLTACRVDDQQLLADTAAALAAGEVVGWFQGRMEFGPRALGNRSILGDARSPAMQAQMNLKIKERESFRPFAPLVLADKVGEWFELDRPSPYMLLVAQVKADKQLADDAAAALFGLERLNRSRSLIPAVTHVDYSARVQTVDGVDNPRLHALLCQFAALTGVPVLINTSFNVRGEPPVCSPADAIRCFLATAMDRLVLGNQVLHKAAMPAAAIARARSITFAPD